MKNIEELHRMHKAMILEPGTPETRSLCEDLKIILELHKRDLISTELGKQLVSAATTLATGVVIDWPRCCHDRCEQPAAFRGSGEIYCDYHS